MRASIFSHIQTPPPPPPLSISLLIWRSLSFVFYTAHCAHPTTTHNAHLTISRITVLTSRLSAHLTTIQFAHSTIAQLELQKHWLCVYKGNHQLVHSSTEHPAHLLTTLSAHIQTVSSKHVTLQRGENENENQFVLFHNNPKWRVKDGRDRFGQWPFMFCLVGHLLLIKTTMVIWFEMNEGSIINIIGKCVCRALAAMLVVVRSVIQSQTGYWLFRLEDTAVDIEK